jgi:hypothetical protein
MKASLRLFRPWLLLAAGTSLVPACASNPPAKAPAAGTNGTAPEIATAVPPAAASSASPPAPAPEVTTEPQTVCDLVCEQARVVARPADGPDSFAQATANANKVLEAMQGDLLACYKKRVAVNPKAHGFITVDILIGPDGRVRTVDTTGGAILGDTTMGCIVDRIKKAAFAPPHAGGTLRVQVPFSLRPVAPGDET